MTASEAVCLTRTHIEAKFPKTCTSCGKRYGSLHEYLVETRHVGLPVSYDEEIDDISPTEPFGTISFANCTCGSTLSIDSRGMPLQTMARLMMWARRESARRHITMRQLLGWVREQIDEQVLRGG